MALVKTQGMELFILDNTDTGNEVIKIGRVTGGSGLGGQAGEIDTTNLDSAAKEFVPGLVDNGTVQINLDYDLADAGQIKLNAINGGANTRFFIAGSESTTAPTFATSAYTLPTDRTTFDFVGGVTQFSKDFTTDDIIRGSVTVRVSGAITETAPV
jgi:hypothetical protein